MFSLCVLDLCYVDERVDVVGCEFVYLRCTFSLLLVSLDCSCQQLQYNQIAECI